MATKPRSEMTVDELLIVKHYDHVRNARIKGLTNELSQDQYIALALSPCMYCGERTTVNGVDRLDSDFGYVAGNCVTACKVCNYAKGIMSADEFIRMCIRVSQLWQSLLPATVLPKGSID